jgi:hypothetical protein
LPGRGDSITGENVPMHQPTVDPTAWTLLTEPLPPSRADRAGPIIVLTYPQSGSERLGALLAGSDSLACTAETGILGLCEQAASTWRRAERTGSTLSALGTASVRAMAGTLIAVIKSQCGAQRWCETSTAPPWSARTFLRLYPETKIICFHRSCRGYIAARNTHDVAAAAAQWRAHTEPLLELERDRAGQCLRVRYEDLAVSPRVAAGIFAFVGLDHRAEQLSPASCDAGWLHSREAGLLGRRIGTPLLGQINRLHTELGYPVIAGA